MNTFLHILAAWGFFFLGALAHEIDILRTLKKLGHTRYSCWTASIIGKVVKFSSDPHLPDNSVNDSE